MKFQKISILEILFFLLLIPFNRYTFFSALIIFFYLQLITKKINNVFVFLNSVLILLLIFLFFYFNLYLDYYFIYILILYLLLYNSKNLKINHLNLLRVYVFFTILIICFSIIPSLFLLGTNLYGNLFDPFSFAVGSSVFASNFIANLLLLLSLFSPFKNKTVLFLFIIMLSISGLILGSRTFLISLFISIFLFIYDYVIKNKNHKLITSTLFFTLLFISLPFIKNTRLFTDDSDNGRLSSWTMIFEQTNAIDLIKITDPEDFHLSAFHNIFLDSFFIYKNYGIALSIIYLFIISSLFYFILKSNIKSKLPVFLFLIFNLFISNTTVVWRGDWINVFIPLFIFSIYLRNHNLTKQLN